MALERLTATLHTGTQRASSQGGTAAPSSPARSATQNKVAGFRSLIDQAAQRYNIDAALLSAVVEVESAGNPRAVSPAGAQGLAQLMPGTARDLGVQNALDPAQNLDGAAKYLRQLLGQFKGDVSKALAAYNAGPGNVRKYGGIPPFAETQAYVPAVLNAYDSYRQEPAASPGRPAPAAPERAVTTFASRNAPAETPFRVPWVLELAALQLQHSPVLRDTPPAV